jgi:hypothetical protein
MKSLAGRAADLFRNSGDANRQALTAAGSHLLKKI